MSMISNALITGGVFSQNIDQRQTQKSAIDRLQDAVAHTAFHNSGERFDPPRCHPNTRVAVVDKIETWALRTDPDTSEASIMWLSGAAGAGKSAISQTLAEHFHSKGILIASFFFGRSDSTRNHARSLSKAAFWLPSIVTPSSLLNHSLLNLNLSLWTHFSQYSKTPFGPVPMSRVSLSLTVWTNA
ncbi:hypothetical protein D9619_009547 [Psilocybe cf. subviscida]|uniref:Nephrocystin 3-like N-terminal domain-containing protein n=1 Tax=Psilocybe cf. subviscida TaxID=2480587 RepID=A0A8H5BNC3_9AGAR|nr:hypothetical protein D9619_009547 [Psilocybe cf. subviscida]